MLKEKLQRGFTLIELMVVVSIIGILMAAGILAFTNAQQSARDAKRRADVDAISKAEEQYNSANGSYPINANITTSIATYFPTGAVPIDPKNTGTNIYTVTGGTGATYCVCAGLEKPDSGNAKAASAGGACTYGTGTGANWFCASQRQ